MNLNGVNNDITDRAFAFDGFDSNGFVKVKDIGPCETINCGRGASQSTFNLRVSKGFHLYRTARVEAIAEIFNLFNVTEPVDVHRPRFIGSVTNPQPNASDGVPQFLKPHGVSRVTSRTRNSASDRSGSGLRSRDSVRRAILRGASRRPFFVISFQLPAASFQLSAFSALFSVLAGAPPPLAATSAPSRSLGPQALLIARQLFHPRSQHRHSVCFS